MRVYVAFLLLCFQKFKRKTFLYIVKVSHPADGIHRDISMCAASSEERFSDGAAKARGKIRTGSKVKRKVHSLKATLPPLCQQPPSISAAFMSMPLLSRTPGIRNISSDPTLSMEELPRPLARLGPGRACIDTKWTQGPQSMASALGTYVRTSNDSTAQG